MPRHCAADAGHGWKHQWSLYTTENRSPIDHISIPPTAADGRFHLEPDDQISAADTGGGAMILEGESRAWFRVH